MLISYITFIAEVKIFCNQSIFAIIRMMAKTIHCAKLKHLVPNLRKY